MIRCNACQKTTDQIRYSGPVLFVEGSAGLDETGKINSLGPAKATLTVKLGQELASPMIMLICPSCGASGSSDMFTIIRPSILSDREATVEVVTPIGFTAFVAEDEVDLLLAIFSEERAAWRVPLGDL